MGGTALGSGKPLPPLKPLPEKVPESGRRCAYWGWGERAGKEKELGDSAALLNILFPGCISPFQGAKYLALMAAIHSFTIELFID